MPHGSFNCAQASTRPACQAASAHSRCPSAPVPPGVRTSLSDIQSLITDTPHPAASHGSGKGYGSATGQRHCSLCRRASRNCAAIVTALQYAYAEGTSKRPQPCATASTGAQQVPVHMHIHSAVRGAHAVCRAATPTHLPCLPALRMALPAATCLIFPLQPQPTASTSATPSSGSAGRSATSTAATASPLPVPYTHPTLPTNREV